MSARMGMPVSTGWTSKSRRQFGEISEPIDRPGRDGGLVDPCFEKRMAHAAILRRVQSRPIFAEIVEVRAGNDLRGLRLAMAP